MMTWKLTQSIKEGFGVFVKKLQHLLLSQPAPPKALHPLTGLTFAVSDVVVVTLADLDFLFPMFFLARYCKLLEENSFRGRMADFFYMLWFGASVLTRIVLIGGMIPYLSKSFVKSIFLNNSLTFMMQNPFIHMSFLGVFNFIAAYLPWFLLGFSVLVRASAWVDLLGMITSHGHAYYLMEDVYPRMTGRWPLRTPSFIKALFVYDPFVVVRPANMRFSPPPIEGFQ